MYRHDSTFKVFIVCTVEVMPMNLCCVGDAVYSNLPHCSLICIRDSRCMAADGHSNVTGLLII